jgi:Arc/MetJ-type ribon-helix-helix transcriptional regulator
MVRVGNKEKINITISPYLKREADKVLESGDFASMSELVSISLTKFFATYQTTEKSETIESECSDVRKHK